LSLPPCNPFFPVIIISRSPDALRRSITLGEIVMDRLFALFGAVFMFLGVGAGAFGAHALAAWFGRYPQLQATWETGNRYHIYHALGLFVAAWAAARWPGALTTWAGWLMLAGILIFSGSLYLLVFTRMRWLGAITPLGGFAFLAAWLLIALAAWRSG
jgi:uncharacterized membrane protein YgdD (TMEM256/DUF423 family)